MANEMTYMKSAIPQEVGRRTKVKTEWLGLNETNTLNTGELCEEKNISADAYPYLMPCEKPVVWGKDHYMPYATDTGLNFQYKGDAPFSIFSTGDKLLILCRADVFMEHGDRTSTPEYTLCVMLIEKEDLVHVAPFTWADKDNSLRDVEDYYDDVFKRNNHFANEGMLIPHNTISDLDDVSNGSFSKVQVMIPLYGKLDCETVYATDEEFSDNNGRENYKKKNYVECYIKNKHTAEEVRRYRHTTNGTNFQTEKIKNVYPIDGLAQHTKPLAFLGCSHLGRIFTGDGARIVASNYNSTGITLDTTETYAESNGWNANLFSNTKSESGITAVYSYSGRVVVFKKDFMHEIYNTKNPFRVTDVCAAGCIGQKSIAEIDGYLYFVSEDGVYRYNGESYPVCISEKLKVQRWSEAVAGAFNHKYYLWGVDAETDEQAFYIFDTRYGLWTKGSPFGNGCVGFAQTDFGFFALCNDGYIYRMDSGDYEGQEWSAETDLSTEGTVDTKHLRKVQMYADFTKDSYLKVTLITDSGEKKVFEYTADSDKKVPIRFSVRKSSSVGMRLRFDGIGKIKLYHMELEMTEGGERYVTG